MEGMEDLNVHLVTYNVGNFAPGTKTNFSSLLPEAKPDVVLVGFQELGIDPLTVVVEAVLGEDPWTEKASSTFGALGYTKVRSIKLLGMVLLMFCLEKHVPYLRGIETQYTSDWSDSDLMVTGATKALSVSGSS